MRSRHTLLIVLIVLALAAVVYVMTSRQADHGGMPPMAGAPAIAPPPGAQPVLGTQPVRGAQTDAKITGDYAGDWQAKCGPIADAKAQGQCTEALDAAYGRQAGAPIPATPAPASGGR